MTDITAKEAVLHPRKLWDPLSKVSEYLRKAFTKKETMSAVIPKPVLRGFFRRETFRTIAQAAGLGTITVLAWHYGYAIPRQAAEREFFMNYDIEQHTKELQEKGYMYKPTPEEEKAHYEHYKKLAAAQSQKK